MDAVNSLQGRGKIEIQESDDEKKSSKYDCSTSKFSKNVIDKTVIGVPEAPCSSTGSCPPHWHLASALPQSQPSHHRTR